MDRQSSRCIYVRPVVRTPRLHRETPDVPIATGTKWCVLAIETYLAVLCIAASLTGDRAADEVAVGYESA